MPINWPSLHEWCNFLNYVCNACVCVCDIRKQDNIILRKTYPHDWFAVTSDMFLSIFVDGTSVSIFLLTLILRHEEVNVTALSRSAQISDETEVLLQVSKWWLTHIWNLATYYTYLLKILTTSFYCFSTIQLAAVLHSF